MFFEYIKREIDKDRVLVFRNKEGISILATSLRSKIAILFLSTKEKDLLNERSLTNRQKKIMRAVKPEVESK